MAKKLMLNAPCVDVDLPRIGGEALIGGVVEWPAAPDGKALTLLISVPTTFLNDNVGFKLPVGMFVSVFSYYDAQEYFLDYVTYHGYSQELALLREGYTRVILHQSGFEVAGVPSVPAMAMQAEGEVADDEPYTGSKLGGKAGLLQAEPLGLNDECFALQIYGARFPHPFRGVLGLSDAVGYLFIRPKAGPGDLGKDAGTFFVQTT